MAVFGDYDVDGITATCLLTKHLKKMGGQVISYIPKRFGEGYGLNNEALTNLYRQGVTLVVTVDCGISGYTQVEHGNALGLDIIVTDHHSCPAKLPPALAVVNPRREDSQYPFSKLAGVGVALKLIQALTPEDQRKQVAQDYSDLVAVGTVADVMALEGENRYFVAQGLEKLNTNPLVGLEKLLQETAREKEVTASTVSFTIAPRVNAAGRLDETHIALELLLTQEETRGQELAKALCALNVQRQEIEGKIVDACLALLEENPPGAVVFLWGEDWHPGVLGIVASRLAEKYHRPTFILCSREGVGKGSCRTFGKVDLYQVLTACSEHLLGFGGHAQAAGFTVAEDRLEALKQALEQTVEDLPSGVISREIKLDAQVAVGELTVETIRSLDRLEPCGAGCPRPSFYFPGAELRMVSRVGEGGKHLRLRLSYQGEEIDGIYFHYRGDPLGVGQQVDVAYYPRINAFRGTESPQIQIFALEPVKSPEEILLDRVVECSSFTPEEARALVPDRRAFVVTWNWLQGWQGAGSVYQICQGLARVEGLEVKHSVVCLAVFLSGNLVAITPQAGVEFPVQGHKTDLEQSPLMLHLRACGQNQE